MKLPHPGEIVNLLKKTPYRPMRARELSKRLGVPKEGRKLFKKILKKLLREGAIKRVKGGKYTVVKTESNKGKEELPLEGRRGILSPEGRFLGKFLRRGKTGIIVPRGLKLPPFFVKLSEVKGVRSESLVLAEIKHLEPGSSDKRTAKVIEVLGKVGSLEAERRGLCVEYALPEDFPLAVVKESGRIPEDIPAKVISRRVDLREKMIFTIDNDKAKDFDDAVGILRLGSGYRLWVSIADVSYYVEVGSAIDNEALERGTSIYLPDKVIPMLPERLSNWVCSLVPGEDRLTKTVEMDFDNNGVMVGFRIYNSIIRSCARLTYTEVSNILEKGKKVGRKNSELVESLKIMKELFEKLKERGIERGELDFDLPEPEIIRDELGRTVDVIKSERNVAHGIIEKFMISANAAVAEYVSRLKVPSIYRIHEPPDYSSLKELAEGLKKFGYAFKPSRKVKPSDIQKIILESKGRGEELAVHTMILRSLKRAIYSTSEKGHFGLALKHYTHFTSPIRRYPDLVVHRIINSLIEGKRPPYDEDTLEWIANHSSVKERFADEVEREAIKLERVYMMRSHIGREFEGFVISVLPFGIFVELKDIFVEGFVPREKLKGRKFEVGQDIRVRVVESDIERRRITLDLVL
jgi:ribonuclease R